MVHRSLNETWEWETLTRECPTCRASVPEAGRDNHVEWHYLTNTELKVLELDRTEPADQESQDDAWSHADPGFALTRARDVANGKLARIAALPADVNADGSAWLDAADVAEILEGHEPAEPEPSDV